MQQIERVKLELDKCSNFVGQFTKHHEILFAGVMKKLLLVTGKFVPKMLEIFSKTGKESVANKLC